MKGLLYATAFSNHSLKPFASHSYFLEVASYSLSGLYRGWINLDFMLNGKGLEMVWEKLFEKIECTALIIIMNLLFYELEFFCMWGTNLSNAVLFPRGINVVFMYG